MSYSLFRKETFYIPYKNMCLGLKYPSIYNILNMDLCDGNNFRPLKFYYTSLSVFVVVNAFRKSGNFPYGPS